MRNNNDLNFKTAPYPADSNLISVFAYGFYGYVKNIYFFIPFLVQKIFQTIILGMCFFIFFEESASSLILSLFSKDLLFFGSGSDNMSSVFSLISDNMVYIIGLIFFYVLFKAVLDSFIFSGVIGVCLKSMIEKKVSYIDFFNYVKQNFIKIFFYKTTEYIIIGLGLVFFIPNVLILLNEPNGTFVLFVSAVLFICALISFLIWISLISFFFEMGPYFIVIERFGVFKSVRSSVEFPFRFPISFFTVCLFFFLLSLVLFFLNLTGVLSWAGTIIEIFVTAPLFVFILTRLFLNYMAQKYN